MGGSPIGFLDRAEPAFDAVGVVTVGIHPEHHWGSGVHEFSGDNYLVSLARKERSKAGLSFAPGEGNGEGGQGKNPKQGTTCGCAHITCQRECPMITVL